MSYFLKKFFVLFFIVLISIFIGYKNPQIIEVPKSILKNPKLYYEFVLYKIGLRAQSIFIFLLDKDNTHVVSVEKIFLEKRLRHFGLDKSGNLYLDKENYFYITSDNDGLYKIQFDKFR